MRGDWTRRGLSSYLFIFLFFSHIRKLRPEKLGICLWSHDRLVLEPEGEPGIPDTKVDNSPSTLY